jgi:hypothetical protein
MTPSMRDLLQLRDAFRRRLDGVDGVVSIGFAKSADGPYLRVVVDRSSAEPNVPSGFRGLPVRLVHGSPAVLALGSGIDSTSD